MQIETGSVSLILALGSNQGEREKLIEAALKKIEERIGRILSLSAFYYTHPVGFDSSCDFVNCACEVASKSDIHAAFAITQSIEKELGRVKKSEKEQYADRLIDIDLILADDMVLDTPELTLPHPRFHQRGFVLAPLCEIAPDRIHPLLGKSIRQLHEELHGEDAVTSEKCGILAKQ